MSASRKEAWGALVAAAGDAVRGDFGDSQAKALSEAAKAWAACNGFVQAVGGAAARAAPVVGTGGKKLRSGHVVPYGRTHGTPIEEAETRDLQWLASALTRSIDDPAKSRFAEANRALLDAVEEELASR